MQSASVTDVVVRPRAGGAPDRRRLWFALAFLPLVALGVAREFHGGLASGVRYLAGFAALAILVILVRADFFAQTSIRISGDCVRRSGYFGRSASCPRASVARVLELSLIVSRRAGIPARWLLFLDGRGRPLLRAYAEYYPAEELMRLRQALDVSWEAPTQLRTFAQMRREIPRSFPWTLAHVWLTLIVVAVIAVVIAGIVAAIL